MRSNFEDRYFKNARKNNDKLRGYFDDDDDDADPVHANQRDASHNRTDSPEEDPLDAFMAGVHQQVQVEKTAPVMPKPEIISNDFDNYSDYDGGDLEGRSAPQSTGTGSGAQDEIEYDSDGIPLSISNKEKKRIEPLPPVDHSTINYPSFKKNFYREHAEVAKMTVDQVEALRDDIEVSVLGADVSNPVKSFEHLSLCFPAQLMKEISTAGFEKPTSIQAQALPVALSGRDIIGLAKTGSGKTLSFVWPMLVHILDQPQMQLGDGPIGLILSPTRELASQIFSEAKKFAKVFGIRVCAIFGGAGKWEMTKALKEAPEVVVATPGRLIELIRCKATNLQRCTMVVLDEADRMFEMGFEYQMRSIVNNIRPDRQTLLFSATMKKKIESFAREILTDPVRVVVGTIGQANPDIKQVVELVPNAEAKWAWLAERADEFVAEGKVLIFVLSKAGTEELTSSLRNHFARRQLDIGVECLHGDKDQADRTTAMRKFSKTEETAVLVATDIASRGLDVKDIRTVINYDIAKNIETYVHRIGRTGRMGLEGVVPGTAYTLITPKDGSFAVDLVQNLNLSSQPVPEALMRLAESDSKWGRIRHIQPHLGHGHGHPHHGASSSGPGGGGGRGSRFHRGGADSSNGLGGGRGGLGFSSNGQPAPRAMTSSMLAAATGGTGTGSAHLPGHVPGAGTGVVSQANKYIEGQGMGRGRHLTMPSWSKNNNNEEFSSSSSIPPAPVPAVSTSSVAQFADAAQSIPKTAPPPPPPVPASIATVATAPVTVTVPSKVMPGFVRAATSATNFTSGNITGYVHPPPSQSITSSIGVHNGTGAGANGNSSGNVTGSHSDVSDNMQPKKKSRWDR